MVPITGAEKKYTEENGSESIIEHAKDIADLWVFRGKNKFDI